MYSGANGEFVELTNVGAVPIDMAGWSFDDDSRLAGTQDLSGFGIVQPGQSVILTESIAGDFATAWGLSGVSIVGGISANLGRNDEINIYDGDSHLIDRLTYGDQDFPGSIRTQNVSGNPTTPTVLGANDVFQWTLSAAADSYGSYASAAGDLGNPGTYVPEPTTLVLMTLLGVSVARRR
ncbi:MAG: lamin tail domain-containing protein [Phycisphaerae bacterium]|nr:lamin tail domain-containing protein [Phycisphaerae bacterium]